MSERTTGGSIDELLDAAVAAVNRGELDTAHQLARRVLAADASHPEAGDLLATTATPGSMRRLTIMFCDLVGSTELSARHDPERYRQILGFYKQTCQRIVEDVYDGHIARVKGDGLLILFGHPSAHEDDVRRAVWAGLEIVAALRRLSEETERDLGESLSVRVAVHRGLVFLDPDEDDIYGLAANVAARLQELAPPGSVVVSEEVRRLVDDRFDTRPQGAEKVKGLDRPLGSWLVMAERAPGPLLRRRWTTQLVDRDDIQHRLREAWRARAGGVLLRGQAGIGKSRLAGALAATVADEGAFVVEIAASPSHTLTGFHPLRTLIEGYCRIAVRQAGVDRLRRLRRHLVLSGLDPDKMIPLIAPVLAIEPAAGYVAAASDACKLLVDITSALGHYLRSLLRRGPTLLLIEDAQWLDGSTGALLSQVLGQPSEGLLTVMTARPGTDPLFSGAAVIDLAPLSAPDSAALVQALDPAGALDTELPRLVARGDGVPLYVEHLVRATIDRRLADELAVPEHVATTVPDALYEPLLAQLTASSRGLQVAGLAATIGRDIDRALLARVVDVASTELDDALASLVDDLVLDAPVVPGEPYRFRHELVREVAYELQPPSARRRAHAQVANALMAAADRGVTPDWPVLASHNERAGRPTAALDCYRRSAEEALRRGALAEARGELDRAVDLLQQIPADLDRNQREVDLRLRRAFLAVSSEGNASPTAATDYDRCLEVATRDRSSEALFTTLIVLWGYYASRADLARARQVLETLRAVLEDGREWARPENEAGLGMLDWYGGRFAEAHQQLEAAAAEVDARGGDELVRAQWFLPNDPRTSIWTHLALARFMRGDPAGAEAAFAHADRTAADLPFPQGPFSAAYNLVYAAWVHAQMGELDVAEGAIERVEALVARHGLDFWILPATTQRTEVQASRAMQALAGEGGDGAALSAVAATLVGLVGAWRMIDVRVFLPTVLTTLGITLCAAGEVAAAEERFTEALALADETGARFCVAETLRARALASSDPDQVAARLRIALDLACDQGAVAFQLRIASDLFTRTGDTAARGELVASLSRFAPGASYPELDAARSSLAP